MLLSLLSLLFLLPLSTSLPPTPAPTIYDLLPHYGLPPGLLPNTVTSFSLSPDGFFSVHLPSPCYVHFDYLVYYAANITGTLRLGGIHDLKGVQVRKFLVWLDVDAIKVDLPPSRFVYFEVGWVTKRLDVDQFETVKACEDDGCRSRSVALRGLKLPEPLREAKMLLTE